MFLQLVQCQFQEPYVAVGYRVRQHVSDLDSENKVWEKDWQDVWPPAGDVFLLFHMTNVQQCITEIRGKGIKTR